MDASVERYLILVNAVGDTDEPVVLDAVLVSRDGHAWWNTVGVATDIIDASWQALVDSITYKLFRDEQAAKG